MKPKQKKIVVISLTSNTVNQNVKRLTLITIFYICIYKYNNALL